MDETITNRIKWIDVARGIVIILMVFGHSSMPTIIANWIWSFHMPFFFFIAGLTLSTRKFSSFYDYLKYKSKRFIFPFFVFSVVNLLLSIYYSDKCFSDNIVTIITQGWGGLALWFIPVLYLSELFFFFLERIRNHLIQCVTVILLLAGGYILCYKNIVLPWALSTVFIGSTLLYIGFLLKNQFLKITYNRFWVILCLLSLVVGFVISHFWRLDLCTNQILPFFPLLIGIFAGISLVSIISYRLSIHITKYLTYLGKNTFIILAFSQTFMLCIIKIFGRDFFCSSILSTSFRYLLLWTLLIISIELINRKLPFILGK